jgi:xylulokinase
MTVLLGLDLGITGARAVAIDERGRLLASATADYSTFIPRPGWAEQNPADWWRASREVVSRVAAEVGPGIAAIGLTGQMHGAVFLDEELQVIRPALLWSDTRTARQCDQITERIGDAHLIAITGNPALTRFQATKILWLRDVEPVQYRHVRHVLLPKDYVRLMLTGEIATDVSDASGTLLFDLRRRDWSAQILAALEIPREWLPPAQESGEVSGRIRPSVASELGLAAGTPVAAGAGDHASAAIASGIVEPGCASTSIDTRGIVTADRDGLTIDPSGRLGALSHAAPDRFLLLATTPSAGTALRWWRDTLGGRMTNGELIKLATSAPAGADGLYFLPSLAGDRSELTARGAFVGLRAHHTPAHLTRAVIEGIVLSLRDGLDLMRHAGLEVRTIRATGMGGRSGFWRRLQADIFNLPVQQVLVDEPPAYGAALLAGVAAGVYRGLGEAGAHHRLSEGVNHPDGDRAGAYGMVYRTFKQLYPALRDAAAPAATTR